MHTLLSLLLAAGPLQPLPEGSGALHVTITNVRDDKGTLRCALFVTADGFPGASRLVNGQVDQPAKKGALTCTFEKLPAGRYAVAVLHDEDGDGVLKTGLFGMPLEGYGASNNVLPKLSSPKFEDALVNLEAGARKDLQVTLRY
jgi:uncharacterized protein (DUF2141 family)